MSVIYLSWIVYETSKASKATRRDKRLTKPRLAFLASLKLSIYMSVVAVAIAVSFHLRSAPSALERRIALPLGLIFWFLSVACLVVGLGNYIKTVNKYSRKVAIVQSGWRTQVCFTSLSLLHSYFTHTHTRTYIYISLLGNQWDDVSFGRCTQVQETRGKGKEGKTQVRCCENQPVTC